MAVFRLSVPAAFTWSVLLIALHLANNGRVVAQSHDNKKGPAYTSPPENDKSFPLMGEFAGQIKSGEDTQPLALQIRPIAGNQFQAMAYKGGLPGQPDHEPEAMRLIGLLSGESVILSGGPWAIFVDADGCSIVSSSGEMLGRLDRIERQSPTLGAPAPENATVLFDGEALDHWVGAQRTDNGLLKQGATLRPMFQDFDLHVEFRLPYMPLADGQSRGNSGLYLQSRYECQILDSFGTERMFNGLGALYRQKSPDVNMAFPPLTWQTYDVRFTAPRWANDGTKIRDAHITSWVNGVKVQDDVALPTKTGAGKQEEPLLLPILFQDHGDPVRFRNIWIIDRGLSSAEFPVMATEQQQQAAASVGWESQPKPEGEQAKDESKSDGGDEEAKQADDKESDDKPQPSDEDPSGSEGPSSEDSAAADQSDAPSKENSESKSE
ncbi:DUF1080 domain-containing protein [Roseiconus nitratireducens]|uniref:DUF1080 domain-containing protein n=1 Tax=Roseiconus nitratireducens TaxID=2605748 RepID=A0A5M6D9K3_9BACT|nr:DUF1080 domain-containing protein [Roseiconus nitratireducens]KAA5541875.1 DUF1080 domain-containing protein [Roseiconus nitratireducens]